MTTEHELARAALNQQQQRERTERWETIIPRRFADAHLDGIEDMDPDSETALREWSATASRSNLLLTGPVGTGKTFAAVAAVRPIVFDHGRLVEFWPVVELLDALRPGGELAGWRQLATVAALILDDIGAERTTDWTDEQLYALVNRRWLNELPTICTTNLSPADLCPAVGDRMFSRLARSGALAIEMSGEDRRKKFRGGTR